MPWVRFDDQFPIHRRIAGLSDAAFRLHVAAIFWCARNLTDGYVAAADVEHMGRTRRPYKLVDELVGAGAWHVVAGGWQIHDYLEYQFSKSKILKDRADKAARQKRWLEKQKRRDASLDVSKDVAPSPHPNPTRREGVGEGARSNPPNRARDRKGGRDASSHPFADDGSGTCSTCELPKRNRNHLHAVGDTP